MRRVVLLTLAVAGAACAGRDVEGHDSKSGLDFTVVSADVRRGPQKVVFLTNAGNNVQAIPADLTVGAGRVFVAVRVSNSARLSYKIPEIGILPGGQFVALSPQSGEWAKRPMMMKVDPAVETSVEGVTTCDWLWDVQERHLDTLSFAFRGQQYPLRVRR